MSTCGSVAAVFAAIGLSILASGLACLSTPTCAESALPVAYRTGVECRPKCESDADCAFLEHCYCASENPAPAEGTSVVGICSSTPMFVNPKTACVVEKRTARYVPIRVD